MDVKLTEKLTDEQIENWRKMLMLQVGPYALLMTKDQIQKHRDAMQGMIDKGDGNVG